MKLLAFSGRKQSGKDSVARFLRANAEILFTRGPFKGFDIKIVGGELVETTVPNVELIYFATPMKLFCCDYLGVEEHKLWGTDAQKNEMTHIRWETLPNYESLIRRRAEYVPTGTMTGRQLLQYVGEDFILPMDPNAFVRVFESEYRDLAGQADVILNPDPRKPSQIDCIHRLGGKVIRLLRDPSQGTDRHISETALDPPYDQSNFDAVIDNREMSIEQTNKHVLKWLRRWGWVEGRIDLAKVDWNPKEVS